MTAESEQAPREGQLALKPVLQPGGEQWEQLQGKWWPSRFESHLSHPPGVSLNEGHQLSKPCLPHLPVHCLSPCRGPGGSGRLCPKHLEQPGLGSRRLSVALTEFWLDHCGLGWAGPGWGGPTPSQGNCSRHKAAGSEPVMLWSAPVHLLGSHCTMRINLDSV